MRFPDRYVTSYFLLFAALLLNPSPADASVFGSWTGKLTFTDSSGRNEPWSCQVEITRTANRLYVADRAWCTYMHRELEIAGDKLLVAGKPVGTISNDLIFVLEIREDYYYQFRAEATATGGLLLADIFHNWQANFSEKLGGALLPQQ